MHILTIANGHKKSPNPLFFKENCLHKVYGQFPSNFQIQTTTCRGVQNGCENSLAIVNEVLFYMTRDGVCAFDGSLPQDISSVFGEMHYYNAVAGALGNKYYISMADAETDPFSYHLFVYDGQIPPQFLPFLTTLDTLSSLVDLYLQLQP